MQTYIQLLFEYAMILIHFYTYLEKICFGRQLYLLTSVGKQKKKKIDEEVVVTYNND